MAIIEMNNLDREEGHQLLRDLNTIQISKTGILQTYLRVMRLEGFAASQTAYKDITSSSDIRLLKHKTLKKELIKYYTDLELLSEIIKGNRETILKSLTDFDPYESGWFKVLGDNVLDPSVKEFIPTNDWH